MATDWENKKFNDTSTQEYYNNLQDQSYKALLDQQYQASAAKENALKYTQNMMQRSGYGTQGVSESTGLGIANSYRNALNSAMSTYNQDMSNAYQTALESDMQKSDQNYSNIDELLGNYSNENGEYSKYGDLLKQLSTIGAGLNEDGTLNLNNVALTDGQRMLLQQKFGNTGQEYNQLNELKNNYYQQLLKEGYTPEQAQKTADEWQYSTANLERDKGLLQERTNKYNEELAKKQAEENAQKQFEENGYREKELTNKDIKGWNPVKDEETIKILNNIPNGKNGSVYELSDGKYYKYMYGKWEIIHTYN